MKKKPSPVEIMEVTENPEYDRFLFRCIFHSKRDTDTSAPFRRYRQRREYLEAAIPQGFRKKVLIFNEDYVGTIEYAPAIVSGFPIIGDNVIVMNCIWVHRRAKGHSFGKRLLENIMESEKGASGFATVALVNHWSPYFKRSQMESLGFKSVKSVRVRHKLKNRGICFRLHLMWFPATENSMPTWDESKLLEGVKFRMGHPLYHDRHLKPHQRLKLREILEKC